jgi:aryl-alcohol dehydrogenase-like predicted oxidoreductase
MMERMGLGLAALGRPGYINIGHADDLERDYEVEAMRRRTHAVLDAAYAAGVRDFDTARSYGRAEEFLGDWLRARSPAGVTCASKWGYTYTADWRVQADHHEIKDHTLAALERQWPESRTHLEGYLDLYQIHSAVPETGVLENTDVLRRLAELKREGTRIGLSLSGPAQSDTLRKAMEVRIDGVTLFDAVQATYNLLEIAAADALRDAHTAGLRVIVKEGMANGRLGPRGERDEDAGARRILNEQVQRLGTTPDAFALAFVLSRPWVDIVLSGAATDGHLESNLRAVDVVWDAEAETAARQVAMDSRAYWAVRSNMPWG